MVEFKPSLFVGSKTLFVWKDGVQIASITPLNGGWSLRLKGETEGVHFANIEAAKEAANV